MVLSDSVSVVSLGLAMLFVWYSGSLVVEKYSKSEGWTDMIHKMRYVEVKPGRLLKLSLAGRCLLLVLTDVVGIATLEG